MTELKSLVGEVYLAYKPRTSKKVKVGHPSDVYFYAKKLWDDTFGINEKMLILFLNRAGNIIGYNWHSSGSTSGTLIDRKIIVKMALDLLAASVIMVHNHPSGNTEPSDTDLRMTNEVQEALELMGIRLLDHVIVSHDNYYSLDAENKLIKTT